MAVRFLIIVPILAPMVVAWTGQSGFAMRVLGWSFAGSLIYAAAYEMTTAYCAWLYDQARRDGDKGWEYRIATWAFGTGAAIQQWWHYSHDWAATPKAVTFSAMSMVGVVLWELFARLIHRRKLRADRNLPPALPSLGTARWLRYPVRSWTARSLMIDNPDRWGNATRAWTEAGRILADREARRTGKAYASLYLVSVRRSGPDHGPSTIPAVQALLDRTVLDRLDLTDRTATDRTALPAGGPDRSKELDRGPDRGPADRTALPPGGPDRASADRTPADRTDGPDRPSKGAATSADRGPDRTAGPPARPRASCGPHLDGPDHGPYDVPPPRRRTAVHDAGRLRAQPARAAGHRRPAVQEPVHHQAEHRRCDPGRGRVHRLGPRGRDRPPLPPHPAVRVTGPDRRPEGLTP
ncbi:hypothetical protein O1L60_45455 [Streptomyces diastatochromogenes]|nr:hypothetical protein [Streptomyces diastatochromogenes]